MDEVTITMSREQVRALWLVADRVMDYLVFNEEDDNYIDDGNFLITLDHNELAALNKIIPVLNKY